MNQKCADCGFNFDHTSNSLYKHKYDRACEKNIQRKKELEEEYQKNPEKTSIDDILVRDNVYYIYLYIFTKKFSKTKFNLI